MTPSNTLETLLQMKVQISLWWYKEEILPKFMIHVKLVSVFIPLTSGRPNQFVFTKFPNTTTAYFSVLKAKDHKALGPSGLQVCGWIADVSRNRPPQQAFFFHGLSPSGGRCAVKSDE